MYTVGVLTEKSSLMASKTGGEYFICKLSNLVKHDVKKVEAQIKASNNGKDPSKQVNSKTAMKSYTHNGYKNISFYAFGESYKQLCDTRVGTIFAIIGPKLLSENQEYGVRY